MSYYLIIKKINDLHIKYKAVYKIQNITLAYNNETC